MAKYLFKASYSPEGLRGLMKEGGSARRANLEKVVAGVGGRLEAFYYAYGDTDVYGISDLPDAAAGIALSLAINSSGVVRLETIPLITPEEMDAACKKPVTYRAPGA